MITGKEVKVLDINAEYYGTPPEKLMENAGRHVAKYVKQKTTDPNVLIFCGHGNNGGDGFVAARYISKNFPVTLFLVGKEKHIHTDIAQINFSKLKSLPISLKDERDLDNVSEYINDATVIIDAMLGVGIHGELREPYDRIVKKINQSKNKLIISVDIPTGIGTKTAVQPQTTITFHDQKPKMNKETCGTILIKDIQIPKKAQTHTGPGELSVYYPRPKKVSHKGQNGRVLIIGGGPFTGAPALSGLAALRTGVDLSFIATPRIAADIIASFSPNIIVHPLQSENHLSEIDVSMICTRFDEVDSILIGPGLGTHDETKKAVRKIISKAVRKSKKLVIDADAIHPVYHHHDIIQNSETIITPHAQEFFKLTGEKLSESIEEKEKQIKDWSQKMGITLFLKGAIDVLSDGKTTRFNTIHNQAMTVGGTGDVLAGIIAGLLAKNVSPMIASCMAAFLNGEAGNYAFKNLSYGLLATDIINYIPRVLKKYV